MAKEVGSGVMRDEVTLDAYYLDEATKLMHGAISDVHIDRVEELRQWLINSWNEDGFIHSEVVECGPNALRNSKVVNELLNIFAVGGWCPPSAPLEQFGVIA